MPVINIKKAKQTGIDEFSVFENGHCVSHLLKNSDNMWVITNGVHLDSDESRDALCNRNNIVLITDEELEDA